MITALLAVAIGSFGLINRQRRGRWRPTLAVGDAPQEVLGRRIVRGSPVLQHLVAGTGLVLAAVLGWLALARPAQRTGALVGAAVLLTICTAAAVGLHRWSGRGGVWVTEDKRIARRRGRVRRWP
ncbi:hypothetical protein ACWKWC_03205 [Geodermatophilus nigrescens]